MEPKTSIDPIVDNNGINVLVANLEAMSRDVARVSATVEKLGLEVISITGSMDKVESQWIHDPQLLKMPHQLLPPKPYTKDCFHQMSYIKPTFTPKAEALMDLAIPHSTKSHMKDLEPKYHP